MTRRPPFVTLLQRLAEMHPEVGEVGAAEAAVRAGHVLVDGRPVRNPASRVRADAALVLRQPTALRGLAKLEAALDAFPAVRVEGRVAVDLGAAAGGFTSALLAAGAKRVYALDAGHGQLLGSLRQDPRVVDLEATNVALLGTGLVPEPADVVTIDLSYLALAGAAPYVDQLSFAADADLLALVKPMFELGLAAPPTTPDAFERAARAASAGFEKHGWQVAGHVQSPLLGSRGSVELFLHAVRAG